jgi:hypothetical protein
MSITITLDQDLARRLRSQAKARNLSVQEWALTILANASEHPDAPETWLDLNTRRLALIKKHHTAGLTEAEEKQLTRLQEAAAELTSTKICRRPFGIFQTGQVVVEAQPFKV